MSIKDDIARAAATHTAATLHEAAQAEHMGSTPPVVYPATALDPAISAAWPGARIAGPAFTVQGAGGDNLALHYAVEAAPAGCVLVVDVNGAPFGHWGEVLAVAAQHRGIAGLLIDGGIRDTAEQAALGFAVFARGTHIRGTRKLFAGQLGRSVDVGGVTVRTGDLVVGDVDGVVCIGRDRVPDVLARADARVKDERTILAALRSGATTLELYGLTSNTTKVPS